MQSTLLQTKPAFSWKALGWALLYFWFFSDAPRDKYDVNREINSTAIRFSY